MENKICPECGKKEINRRDLKTIILKAFQMGDDWGTTYQGWFVPTSENHIERRKRALKECLGLVKLGYHIEEEDK